MRIGDIERIGEREIPMPRFTPPPVEPTPSPLTPAPTRERGPREAERTAGAKEVVLLLLQPRHTRKNYAANVRYNWTSNLLMIL
jgi:hypothetical protein